MIPILYDKSEKQFTSNGIGRLADAISCKVTEKRNATYQATLEYPVAGALSRHIKVGNIIYCKIPYKKNCQPFDIVEVESSGNMLHITAEHISRRLKYAVFNVGHLFIGDPKMMFESLNDSNDSARQSVVGISDFHFFSDVTEQDVKDYLKDDTINLSAPFCSVGDNMLDFLIGTNGMLSRKSSLTDDGRYSVTGFGDCGDFSFFRFNVFFKKNRGTDSGVKLRVGSNVQRLTFLEEDRQSVTGVCPVWIGRNPVTGGETEKSLKSYDPSSDGIVYGEKKYDYHRIVKLDLSTVFEQPPTKEEMIRESKRYLQDHERNNLNSYCSYSIDVPPTKSDFLDCIELCDIVTIEDVELQIQKKLKVTELEYDSLREHVIRIVVGNPKPTVPELLERKNAIFIDNVNRSLTRTDDLSKKTVVAQKKYPVGYDPNHPERWENTGQKLVDATGKEMEEIATVNRHPVFVYKGGGDGGSKIPILYFGGFTASATFFPQDLQYTIPYTIITNGSVRQEKSKPVGLLLNSVTLPIESIKVGIPFEITLTGKLTMNDPTHKKIYIPCTFCMKCTPTKIVNENVEVEMLMKQCEGICVESSFVCTVGFVNKDTPEDNLRLIKNASFRRLQ